MAAKKGDVRICPKCGDEYIFSVNYRCKKCDVKSTAEYNKTHRDKKRAWNNDHFKRMSKEHRYSLTKNYRERHPEQYNAHILVQSAVRNGSLQKGVCEFCGDKNANAHHDDYNKPLDVRWLCHIHHMEYHSMVAEKARREAER